MDTVIPVPISPDALKSLIGRADAPLLLDVRRQPRFDASPTMLAGAVRCPPENVAALAVQGPPRAVVVYCVYGHEVSQIAARTLAEAGWDAKYLAGGIEGGEPGVDAEQAITAWRAVDLPRMTKPQAAGSLPPQAAVAPSERASNGTAA